ncbi:hypothetical protein BH23GEM9_BH23GEM9_00430 [soil metagenome]
MLENLIRRTRQGGRGVRMRARRKIPLLPLVLYYGALITIGFALIEWVPGAEEAIAAPIAPVGAFDLFGGSPAPALAPETPWGGAYGRLILTLFAISGAVALALPVAGIYMHTRRLRYDPSLVQTMIMLPIVVAGVVIVVKNSLALAFALAGIVAGVRFRQKLNEPKDAVYVLLSLGLGLAAAVQALDIALAVSMAFNVVVLALWRYDPRSSDRAGLALSMGDTALLSTYPPLDKTRVLELSELMDSDGVLTVHAPEPGAARRAVEVSLTGVAEEWRMTDPAVTSAGMHRFEVLVRLRKNADPVDILSELEERWASQISAAEYTPFHHRREEDEDDEDDDD